MRTPDLIAAQRARTPVNYFAGPVAGYHRRLIGSVDGKPARVGLLHLDGSPAELDVGAARIHAVEEPAKSTVTDLMAQLEESLAAAKKAKGNDA